MERLGKRIRALRESLGMSQSKLARAIDKKPHYVNQMESGAFTPSVRMLYRIAEALDVSPHKLLEDEKRARPNKAGGEETETYMRRIRGILESSENESSKRVLKVLVDFIHEKKGTGKKG